ncbi:MAG: hypothetical protein ACKVX7_05260 [Planctomycetota bacterium]
MTDVPKFERMVERIEWRGGLDGLLVLAFRNAEGGLDERALDRPGDVVIGVQAASFASEAARAAAAAFGVCVATKNIDKPVFVRQILEQALKFMRGVAPDSVALYHALDRLRALVESSSQQGIDLRAEVLAEVERILVESR